MILILEGAGYGLFLSILVGPLLMTLIHITVHHGINKGLVLASGIWLSDFLIISTLILTMSQIKLNLTDNTLTLLAVLAACIFIVMGVIYFIKVGEEHALKLSQPNKNIWLFFKRIYDQYHQSFYFCFLDFIGHEPCHP